MIGGDRPCRRKITRLQGGGGDHPYPPPVSATALGAASSFTPYLNGIGPTVMC